jgi:phosphoglucosamine mutase
VASKPPLASLPKLSEKLQQVEKELGNSGRVLFRYSGTESLARITIEGLDAIHIRDLAREIEEIAVAEIASVRS